MRRSYSDRPRPPTGSPSSAGALFLPGVLERHPDRRMIARLLKAAHPSIDARVDEARRERAIEQHVIDAQAGITLPVVAEVIPEGVDALFGMARAQRVDPALREKALVQRAALRLQEGIPAP